MTDRRCLRFIRNNQALKASAGRRNVSGASQMLHAAIERSPPSKIYIERRALPVIHFGREVITRHMPVPVEHVADAFAFVIVPDSVGALEIARAMPQPVTLHDFCARALGDFATFHGCRLGG